MARQYEVDAPWRLDSRARVRVRILDLSLAGNRDHFLRFDLYPYVAPSVGRRHFGYWDLPLSRVKERRLEAFLADDTLVVEGSGAPIALRAGWRGKMAFAGHLMLHVSLWDASTNPPTMREVVSSFHAWIRPDGHLPLDQIQIPITQRCNLQCLYCQRQHAKGLEEADIDDEVLTPLLDTCPHVALVHVQGVGESLLNRRLFEILRQVRARLPTDGRTGTCTNATLLTEETASRLLDTGLDYLFLSLDGAKAETNDAIRRGSSFDELTRNIARCVEMRRSRGLKRPWFMLDFVICETNATEVPDFVDLAGRLGVDSVRFANRVDHARGRVDVLPEDILAPILKEAESRAQKLGLAAVFPRLSRSREPRCPHLQAAIVLLSGDAAPCCAMEPGARPRPPRFFGNVKDTPLLDLWHGENWTRHRLAVAAGNLPETCVGCDNNRNLTL